MTKRKPGCRFLATWTCQMNRIPTLPECKVCIDLRQRDIQIFQPIQRDYMYTIEELNRLKAEASDRERMPR